MTFLWHSPTKPQHVVKMAIWPEAESDLAKTGQDSPMGPTQHLRRCPHSGSIPDHSIGPTSQDQVKESHLGKIAWAQHTARPTKMEPNVPNSPMAPAHNICQVLQNGLPATPQTPKFSLLSQINNFPTFAVGRLAFVMYPMVP